MHQNIFNIEGQNSKEKVREKPSLNIQINSQTEFRYYVNIVGSKKKK